MRALAVCAALAVLALSGCLNPSEPANRAPSADAGGTYTVSAGSTLTFAASAIDRDGHVVLCEWDFDGDGTYDWSSDSTAAAQHRYLAAGTYTASLRATDDEGNSTVAECQVTVVCATLGTGGPYWVTAGVPLTLNGSCGDLNRTLALYEWDFDGDGTYDWASESSASAEHTYEGVGTYHPRLRAIYRDGEPQTETTVVSVVMDIATVQQVRSHVWRDPLCVAISGDWVVSGSYFGKVDVMDLASGDSVATFEGHSGKVRSLAVAGRYIISGSDDQTVRIWDVATGRHARTLTGHEGAVLGVVVIGNMIASGSADGTVRLWNLYTGNHIATLSGGRGPVVSVAAAGDVLIWGTGDGTLSMWDVGVGENMRVERLSAGGANSIGVSGQTIVLGGTNGAVSFGGVAPSSFRLVISRFDWWTPSVIEAIAVAGDRIALVASDGCVRIWSLATRSELATLPGAAGQYDCVAVSEDGQWLVAGSTFDTMLRVYRAQR